MTCESCVTIGSTAYRYTKAGGAEYAYSAGGARVTDGAILKQIRDKHESGDTVDDSLCFKVQTQPSTSVALAGVTTGTLTGTGTHTIQGVGIPSGNPTVVASDVNSWQLALPAKSDRKFLRIQNLSDTHLLFVRIGSGNYVALIPLASEIWENTVSPTEAVYVSGPNAGQAFSATQDAV